MTGWIILGSILLVLILILAQSVKVTAVYDQNPEVTVKILCFTLVKIPEDEKTRKKKAAKARKKAEKERRLAEKQQKKAAKAQKKGTQTNEAAVTRQNADEAGNAGSDSEDTDAGADAGKKADAKKAGKPPKQKAKLPDIDFDMIRDYMASAAPPVKRLFRKIRIRDVYIDWVVGSDDAAKTALKYGGICSAVYPVIEWMTTYFNTDVREVNIEADFSAEKDDIFAYITLKLRISTALGCAIWLGFRMLKTFLKYNKNTSKTKSRPVRVKAR